MPKMKPSLTTLLLLILVTTTAPRPTHSLFLSLSFSLSQYRNLVSLAHSLLTRISKLRADRGDISGSNRARLIAQKLERGLGLGFLGLAWSVAWDYVKNYAWRGLDYRQLSGIVPDLNELRRCLSELMRVDSEVDKATWIRENYENVLQVSKRLFARLLDEFRQSGTLREVVEIIQKEVVDGGLLRDCMVLGSDDLKGLRQIFEDLTLHFPSAHSDPDSQHEL